LLVDREGTLLSVETDAWRLTPDVSVKATVAAAAAGAREMKARPVSPRRANIIVANSALLTELQGSEKLAVSIGAVKVDLAFDDFNAARVVLESCVQKIGRNLGAPTR
jgi:hypothetical protein